jgi:hypothetical protein
VGAEAERPSNQSPEKARLTGKMKIVTQKMLVGQGLGVFG